MNGHHSLTQWLSNVVGGGTVAVMWAGLLPTTITIIASLVALIWYTIQIHESETVRRWVASRRARKIAKLKARLILLEAKTPPLPARAS